MHVVFALRIDLHLLRRLVHAIESIRSGRELTLLPTHHRLLGIVQAQRGLVGHEQLGGDPRAALILEQRCLQPRL